MLSPMARGEALTMSDQEGNRQLIQATAEVVAAYVRTNQVFAAVLPDLIRQVHMTLTDLGGERSTGPKIEPRVPIKKSVTPNYVICLDCGQKRKVLKGHVKVAHQMTLSDYLKKWNLPADYPVVAPMYSARRSVLAKHFGLGTQPRKRSGKRTKA
jgi:predicted transcriptional regulator